MIRTAYANEAVLDLDPDADEQTPGAAVTVELCGHWEHVGPCAHPHHTSVVRQEVRVLLRTIWAGIPVRRTCCSHLRRSAGTRG